MSIHPSKCDAKTETSYQLNHVQELWALLMTYQHPLAGQVRRLHVAQARQCARSMQEDLYPSTQLANAEQPTQNQPDARATHATKVLDSSYRSAMR